MRSRSLLAKALLVVTLGVAAQLIRPPRAEATEQCTVCAPTCDLGLLACHNTIRCYGGNPVWDTCLQWPCQDYSWQTACAGA
jgi:hypothetical protein